MSDHMLGIIGGTGLGDALAEHISDVESVDVVTPFGKPSSSILVGKINGRGVAFLNRHGDGHRFDPLSVPYKANVYALKKLGVTSCIASGAVGSLSEKIQPGELVVVDQLIDKTFRRDGSFFTGMAAVHCEFAHPYCGRLREKLLEASQEMDVNTHDGGVYVCMEGPQFSTRAESMMHRTWGGELIGMTALPEAKLAREAQMCFALVAMPSDRDCWVEPTPGEDKQALLEEIIGNLNKCTENIIKLIKAVLAVDSELIDHDCGCRSSLENAILTKPHALGEDVAVFIDVLKK